MEIAGWRLYSNIVSRQVYFSRSKIFSCPAIQVIHDDNLNAEEKAE